ncbi:MAG TPA: 3'(2'),5'-bisphosphate nucleotidase CysQ [Haloplasmataceae bacterium]
MDFSQELYEMKKAAITAGKKVLEIYHTDFEVEYKDDKSPVTLADIQANEIIIGHLRKCFPNYAILSEESVDDESRLDNDYCFIIDPIDGTKDFVNKTGEFTVNIALAYKQKIVVGVIYVPVLDELYFAEKGKGAYKVKEQKYTKLCVSDRQNKLRVAESRSHKSQEVNTLYKLNEDKIEKIYEIGSTLKGCFLASGFIEAFYKFGLGTKEWDIATMDILIHEANGIFRDLNHQEFIYNKKDVYNKNGYYAVNNEKNLFAFHDLLKK